MKPFAHFILTRFNVRRGASAAGRDGSPRKELDPEWLKRRFDWFERLCLPSVDRQTEGAFQWLIFLDWATPVAFKEKMAALAVHYDYLRPIYCTLVTEETALDEIRRLEAPETIRITTTLDNDDVLHPRLIQSVQEAALGRLQSAALDPGFFLSFPVGYVIHNGNFYLRLERYNSFVSYVSRPDCPRTVLTAEHEKIAEAAPVFFYYRRPLWGQIIHEDNAGVRRQGLYCPWGGRSALAAGLLESPRRPLRWQVAEVLRSAKDYWLARSRPAETTGATEAAGSQPRTES